MRALVCVAAALMLWSPPVYAQSVPAERRAAIVLRAAVYERAFSSRRDDIQLVVIGGVEARSQADALQMGRAFRALARRLKVGKRSLRVSVAFPASSAAAVDLVREQSPDLVYVAIGLDDVNRALARDAGQGRRIITCGNVADVGRGCVLSVERNGKKARLVIDANGARRAGLRFDGRLLRLARLYR